MTIKGIGASYGDSFGKAFILKNDVNIVYGTIEKEHMDEELNRADTAVALVKSEIENALRDIGASKVQIDITMAHKSILQDKTFLNMVRSKIRDELKNAETAFNEAAQYFIDAFEKMNSEYMRQRAADIDDIGKRILTALLGEGDKLANISGDNIVIADEITVSEIIRLKQLKVKGIIMSGSSTASHTSIIARSMGIPAIIGVGNVLKENVTNGISLVMNGKSGEIIIEPEEKQISECINRMELANKRHEENKALKDVRVWLKDGRLINLYANIGSPDEIEMLHENGAEGVGLFRTEFVFMNRRTMPSENEQARIYASAVKRMKGKPIIIRTLDVGGDKKIPYIDIAEEQNPFLGLRGVRYTLSNQGLFKEQIRAILKAGAYGPVKILVPMITTVDEIRKTKLLIETAKKELADEKVPYSPDVETGIMIEVPAAALITDILIKEVDFVSIGTNDLCQYMMAVDRGNPGVSVLYDFNHPAMQRMIKMVVDAAHAEGKHVCVCGEAASDTDHAVRLVGLGVDTLSMNALHIPEVKRTLLGNCQAVLESANTLE